jgi:hypothetical protein
MDTTHHTTPADDISSEAQWRLRMQKLAELNNELDELNDELALGAQVWIDENVDARVYTGGPEWPLLFGDALGQVRVAADDARERTATVEVRFWTVVDYSLGSVLTHQGDRLGIAPSPEKDARFIQAVRWWEQGEIPALHSIQTADRR